MIKHLVFMKFAPEAQGQSAAANMAEVKRRLETLPPLIPEIAAYEVGLDVIRSPRSWDLALYSAFADLDALERYRVHPAHQEVLGLIKAVTSDIAAVDYAI